MWSLAAAICHGALAPEPYCTCSLLMDVWKENRISLFFSLPSDSISNTHSNSPLYQIGSLAWHHVRHNRWHLSAGFEGLLIFTDMQSVRLLFRLRAREIKCPGEKPFIRDSLSAALHMEPHPSPFAWYLWPISLAGTIAEPLLLGCTTEWSDDSWLLSETSGNIWLYWEAAWICPKKVRRMQVAHQTHMLGP